jgi:hypothetical protein
MTTDDAPVEADPVVRTALQLLPVPPHGDDFWVELDRAITAAGVAEPAAAAGAARPLVAGEPDGAATPVVELQPDHALGIVPPSLRRRSNALAALAAVAAAVLVVVAGTTLIRQRNGDVDTTEVAGTAPEATTLALPSTTLLSAPTVSGEDDERSSDAVLAWLAALGEGDGDAAWDAMGPGAKGHLGTRAAFDDMMSALAEGFGAWAAATPDQVLVTPMSSTDDTTLVIVTLVGEVEQEGTRQERADSFAVRLVDGKAELEPFDAAGEVEVVVPDGVPGSVRTLDGDELVVVIPQGADAPVIRIDDGPAVVCGEAPGTELTDLDGAPGRRCEIAPDGGIPSGRRLLTVAFSAPDSGAISTESVLFDAA